MSFAAQKKSYAREMSYESEVMDDLDDLMCENAEM